MVIALWMACNLSMLYQLISPTAILCIIPPLSTDFVINIGMGSSCEIGRQGLIFVFSKTPQIVSTLYSAYKVPPSKFAAFPMASSNSSHQCFLETLQLVKSTWFHAVLSLCMFLSITGLPFPVISAVGLGEVQIWIWCKCVQGERGSIWKPRWVDCIPTVGTFVTLYSPSASKMSQRPRQPGSDLTIHLQNTSIP